MKNRNQDFNFLKKEDDWQVVTTFLPPGWEEKAKELKALQRCRKFQNAGALLRTLLIHLSEGCSLRETSARAGQGELVDITDVGLLKRLKVSGEWFRWMAAGVKHEWVGHAGAALWEEGLRIRVIDGSVICEPGSTGSTWRIHYSIELPTLQCNEVYVTTPKTGESFKQFTVQPGDLFLGDRAYGTRGGVAHVVLGGGNVLVRINLTNFPMVHENREVFSVLDKLRTLKDTGVGDWDVWIEHEGTIYPGRLCAIRKSRKAAEEAKQKIYREAKKKKRVVKPETLEAAEYIFVFTTLGRDKFSPETVLEIYRLRWQIELVFKRLKSIIGIGHLKKTDPIGTKAWLHGKLLVAMLIEAMITAGMSFFPWGYPIRQYAK